MPLITSDDAKLLRDAALSEADEGTRWNLTELGASFILVRRFLGESWMNLAIEALNQPPPANPPTNHDFMTKPTAMHPIGRLLLGGTPENYGRLVRIAHSLAELATNPRIRGLADRLNQLAASEFWSVVHELSVAAVYARAEYEVEFVKPVPGRKSPDLKLKSPGGVEFVLECKRKESMTQEAQRLDVSCTRMEANAFDTMTEANGNYLIHLTLHNKPTPELIDQARQFLIGSILQNKTGHLSASGFSCTILSGWPIDAVTTAADHPLEFEEKLVHHASLSFWTKDPKALNLKSIEATGWKIHSDAPIKNLRSIVVYSPHLPEIVETVLASLREAEAQIAASGEIGAVAIHLSYPPKTINRDLYEIRKRALALMEAHPEVAAVALLVDQVEENAEGVGPSLKLSTRVLGIENTFASNAHHEAIWPPLIGAVPMRHHSLLEY